MTSVALTSLSLSHFRSHLHSTLDVSGGPIAISGPNGAGKTNVLEAVSLLSPGRGIRRAASDDLIRQPEGLGWKIKAVISSGAQEHEVETWAERGGTRNLRIDGKAAPQTALGGIARILWLTPAMDRLWIEGADGRRRFLDRMTLSFEPAHAEASLTYEKAMRERNRLLKDGSADRHWYAALEETMADTGARIRRNRSEALSRVALAQGQSQSAFPAADLDIVEPEDAPDLIAAYEASRPADLRAGRTLVGPHRADLKAVYREKGVSASQCSTGEQKALLISLVLANSRALSDQIGQSPIILLDEVAAHLDPDRRASLYDELCELGGQAWLTGTEPELFNAFGDRAQGIQVADSDGVSRLRS